MARLSLDVTPEQHKRLKALAALQGKSLKDYVLDQVLPTVPGKDFQSEEEALRELEAYLKPRIEAAQNGNLSSRSVDQIFEDVQRKSK